MKKDILVVAHFCSDFDGKGNNRFNYLLKLFEKEDHNVEFITSDFSHIKKERRSEVNRIKNCKITMIHEPEYYKNVSIKRIYSHYIMAKKLETYLKTREKPDVIYCSVPSLSVANVISKYASKYKIRLIIDIQDLWPEAFEMLIKAPIVNKTIFSSLRKQANIIYMSADEIIGVSQTYVDRALQVNKKVDSGHSIFLGTELIEFDRLADLNINYRDNYDDILLAYIGTLGHSYDIRGVIDALEIIKSKGISNIRFLVMGDGPLKKSFEAYAKSKDISIEFCGRMDYGKMVGVLKSCDIAINPITKGAAQSIINKHSDYAASGLPVINTQECKEYRDLVERYNMGLNCVNNNPEDLAEKIMLLSENKSLRVEMGRNSRKLAEEKFDRKYTYPQIVKLIIN